MTTYEVQDYRKPLLYRVTSTGVESGERIDIVRVKTTREAFDRSTGYAAWLRVSLLRHARRVFVALFTDEEALFFRFGNRTFDCLANRVEAAREGTGPCIKRFRFCRQRLPLAHEGRVRLASRRLALGVDDLVEVRLHLGQRMLGRFALEVAQLVDRSPLHV